MEKTIVIRLLIAAAILLVVFIAASILQGAEPIAQDECMRTVACLTERSQKLQAQMNSVETQFQALPNTYKELQAQKKATDDQIEKMLPKGSEKK